MFAERAVVRDTLAVPLGGGRTQLSRRKIPILDALRRVRDCSTVENWPILGEPWEDMGEEKKKGMRGCR